MNYFLHLGVFVAIYVMLAVGLNVLVGYCGRLSLTHIIFFAVGAYSYAYGQLILHWGVAMSVILGLTATFILSGLFVLTSHRRYGDEYVLISLALHSVGYSIIANWYDSTREFGTFHSFTNGPFGVSGLPASWLGQALPHMFLGAVAICVLMVAVTGGVLVAPWGRALKAVRDDEGAAQNLGKGALRLHLEAAWLASSLASIAGALYTAYVRYIDQGVCDLGQAVLILSMVIVGGVGNLRGPIVGAVALVCLPEILKFFQLPSASIDSIRLLIYGLALTVLMHFRPHGIVGARRLGDLLHK